MLEQLLDDLSYTDQGWELEQGYGDDGNLICPCGDMIELDGICPQGCVSPLRAAGYI